MLEDQSIPAKYPSIALDASAAIATNITKKSREAHPRKLEAPTAILAEIMAVFIVKCPSVIGTKHSTGQPKLSLRLET
jgi:hypothetical protein